MAEDWDSDILHLGCQPASDLNRWLIARIPLKRTEQGFQSISMECALLAQNFSSGRDIGLIENGARCQDSQFLGEEVAITVLPCRSG